MIIKTKDNVLIHRELYSSEDTLCHYGVKGMKWGQRKEAAKDNAQADKYGRQANDNYKLYQYAQHIRIKANKKYKKKPTDANKLALARAKEKEAMYKKEYAKNESMVKNHHKQLVSKWGANNVTDISRNPITGHINEGENKHIYAAGPMFGLAGGIAAAAYDNHEKKKYYKNGRTYNY